MVVCGGGWPQCLTTAMDEGGHWQLTVAMGGSCGSGGQ